MQYMAIVTKEGSATLAEFPDCPGCQTFVRAGDGRGTIVDAAQEALEGWLETTLVAGDEIPAPSRRVRVPRTAHGIAIEVPPRLAIKIALRLARQAANLTQAQLAKRAGVSQQQIAKLEDPDSNPTLETLEKAARALDCRLEVSLVRRAGPGSSQPRLSRRLLAG
jgi:DNA-binding XRE family transcriptional regulator/predicted RNase H-like HicB family nuclease